nr:DUF3800 domain-containing protein [Bacillus sp. T33-2]
MDFVVANGHMIGFRAIAVNKTKISKPIDTIITELFYQLVRTGVEYERNTGRINLPKQITYIKDAEEGESALRLTQIEQLLVDNFKIHYDGELKLNAFFSLDSKMNRFIQIADLFTGAINRKLNHLRNNPDSMNSKDEFANYVYELFNIEERTYETQQLSEIDGSESSDLATLYIFD